MSGKVVPQPRTYSSKTSVSIAAAGSSDNTNHWVGRTQLTMTFIGDQLTVDDQLSWSHAK